jgi:hypothetical protein
MVVADEDDTDRGRSLYERDGCWAGPTAEQLNFVARDKCSLDLFWLKDESLLDADSLPDPDVIAELEASRGGHLRAAWPGACHRGRAGSSVKPS